MTATTATASRSALDALLVLLRALKLPAFARYAEEVAQKAEREGWTFGQYLHHLAELEVEERQRPTRRRALQRLGPAAREDAGDPRPTPAARRRWRSSCRLCAKAASSSAATTSSPSGCPAAARPTSSCAIGHELIQRGYRVLFTPTYALVQRLLAAKRDLRLEQELAALDGFDAVILDDIGYVQQSRDEMEVLFTFLAERYERKSVIITSNLVFSCRRPRGSEEI